MISPRIGDSPSLTAHTGVNGLGKQETRRTWTLGSLMWLRNDWNLLTGRQLMPHVKDSGKVPGNKKDRVHHLYRYDSIQRWLHIHVAEVMSQKGSADLQHRALIFFLGHQSLRTKKLENPHPIHPIWFCPIGWLYRMIPYDWSSTPLSLYGRFTVSWGSRLLQSFAGNTIEVRIV